MAPFDCDDSTATLRRVELLTDGQVASLSISASDNSIVVECDSDIDADDVRARIHVMFQLNVPIHRFHDYCAANSKLAHIPGKRQGRMLCSPTLWEDCCKVILTTNTTWAQTVGMTKRLVDAFGSPVASNHKRRAFPLPEQVAAVPFAEFEKTARFGYRNQSIHNLATMIASGDLNLEVYRDAALSGPELSKRLLELRGIGPYAASCLMIYLGRYDRVNVDSWARMMVSQELERKVTDKEVHEFFAPHGEWSGLVYHFYPWRQSQT